MSKATGADRVSVFAAPPSTARRFPLLAALVLSGLIVGGTFYGRNHTTAPAHVNGENFRIAQALYAGEGFANSTGEKTGPSAWCAPVYPTVFVVLLWLGDGDRDFVTRAVAIFQVFVLIGTSVLVLALAWQTTQRTSAWLAAAIFLGGLVCHFSYWFPFAYDCWLMLLTFDLLIAGCCWLTPLATWQRAMAWGVFGGLCAMVNPSIALAWGALTLALKIRGGSRPRTAVALLLATLTLAPWTVRNYLMFGHLIPVKSNLAYELYQTQCLQNDGLYQATTARLHPTVRSSREHQEFKALGEAAYLDRKRQQFWASVSADPVDFLDRVADRFLGATVWYVPFDREAEGRSPWLLLSRRLAHPLPFLALVFLLFTSFRDPLAWPQWTVIGVYIVYLLPYIAASYYERYAVPLDAVKVLLVTWGVDRLCTKALTWDTNNKESGKMRI